MQRSRAEDLKHLVLHFTSGAAWRDATVPIYVRGEGCHIWDEQGQRYLDGLAGLFVVQIGHGRSDIANAAAKQMETLAYTPSWSATHPSAVDCATLISGLAPGDLDAVFFVTSGSEAVESVIKFSRQYHASQGRPSKTGVISRFNSYHGTTMGALSATGLQDIRTPFLPLLPGFHHVANTQHYSDGVAAAKVVEDAILEHGPDTIGLVLAEPVQNGGGALVPPTGYWKELRRICDKYDVLLAADEVINSFGRLGRWFGSDYVDVVPDMLTFAKGSTSGYAPIGGVIMRRHLVDSLMDSDVGTFTHGATWGGHPVAMAAAIANITAMRDEKVVENAAEHEGYFRGRLEELAGAHDVVSEVRGAGYFYAVELQQANGEPMSADVTKQMVGTELPRLIRNAGLLIRADARGQAKLMLSPPLIARTGELDELTGGVDRVLDGLASALSS